MYSLVLAAKPYHSSLCCVALAFAKCCGLNSIGTQVSAENASVSVGSLKPFSYCQLLPNPWSNSYFASIDFVVDNNRAYCICVINSIHMGMWLILQLQKLVNWNHQLWMAMPMKIESWPCCTLIVRLWQEAHRNLQHRRPVELACIRVWSETCECKMKILRKDRPCLEQLIIKSVTTLAVCPFGLAKN